MHKTDSTVFIPSGSVYQQKAPITTIQKLCRCYFLLYAGIYLIKPHILGAIFEKKKNTPYWISFENILDNNLETQKRKIFA